VLPRRTLVARVLIALAAGASVFSVASLVPRALDFYRAVPPGGRPAILAVSLTLAIALLGCLLAIVLVVRAGERYEARALALFLLLVSATWGSILRFASLDVGPDSTGGALNITASGWLIMAATAGLALTAAVLLRLSWRFPFDFSAAAAAPEAGRLRRAFGRAWVPWALAASVPLVVRYSIPLVHALFPPPDRSAESAMAWLRTALFIMLAYGSVVILGMIALAVLNFLAGYRRAEPGKRRAALWLVVGIVGAGLAILVTASTLTMEILLPIELGFVTRQAPLIAVAAPLFMVLCVAVAVFGSGAIDPTLALRRSTINGIAGMAGLTVFAGLENVLSAWVEGRLGLPGSLGSFLAGGVAAAVFVPVRHALRRVAAQGREDAATP